MVRTGGNQYLKYTSLVGFLFILCFLSILFCVKGKLTTHVRPTVLAELEYVVDVAEPGIGSVCVWVPAGVLRHPTHAQAREDEVLLC